MPRTNAEVNAVAKFRVLALPGRLTPAGALGLFLAFAALLAQGCAEVKVSIPAKPARFSARDRLEGRFLYGVYSIHHRPLPADTNALVRFFEIGVPHLRSDNPDLRGLPLFRLGRYYQEAGALDAARRFSWARTQFELGGASTLVVLGAAIPGLVASDEGNPGKTFIGPYWVAVMLLGVAGEFWFLHEWTQDVNSSTDLFNQFLKDRLGLSLYTGPSGTGIQFSRR